MSRDEEECAELAAHILAAQPEAVDEHHVTHNALTFHVRTDHLLSLIAFVRDDSQCRFESLIDICGVDYPEREKRFDLVYHFLSMRMNQRVRIKIAVADGAPVESLTGLFPAAGWYEREAFDMYGIVFSNHPDLRRLLTDYGFEGYPLRKDFPLSGHHQVRYDLGEQKVVREPVTLVQAYRDFDFQSPWEGIIPAMTSQEEGADGK